MENNMNEIVERLSQVGHGFYHVEAAAKELFISKPLKEVINIAQSLLENDIYQARMLAVFLLGYAAPMVPEALEVLKERVSLDGNWRVQEILAKAFDHYCGEVGYENALHTIQEWLDDQNINVNRAVTEGLRIWTSRPFFDIHPELAIALVSKHKASESEYLRKSVGNSLHDISKKHMELISNEISKWDLSDKKVNFTYKYVTKVKSTP